MYDLVDDVCAQTPLKKVEEWLGNGFFGQYGVTPAQLDEARKWIKVTDSKRDADDGVVAPGANAPTAKPPVTNPAAPPTTAAAPTAPVAPQPPAPQPPAPQPPAPPAPPLTPAQEAVVGPDGAMLPPGVRWQKHTDGKPYFWHVSNTAKTGWAPADVAVPS
jgi:hypothetical protein